MLKKLITIFCEGRAIHEIRGKHHDLSLILPLIPFSKYTATRAGRAPAYCLSLSTAAPAQEYDSLPLGKTISASLRVRIAARDFPASGNTHIPSGYIYLSTGRGATTREICAVPPIGGSCPASSGEVSVPRNMRSTELKGISEQIIRVRLLRI